MHLNKKLFSCGVVAILTLSMSASAETAVSGKQYLESVQQVISSTLKKVSPSIVYMELSMKKPGRASTIALNGMILDKKGHIATLYFKESDVNDIKVWIGEQEFQAKIVKTDRINGLSFVKIESDDETVPVSFADTSKLNTGQFVIGISATSKNIAFEPVANLGTLKAVVEGSRDYILVNGFATVHSQDIPTYGMPIVNLDGEIIAWSQGRSIGLIDNTAKAIEKFLKRKEKKMLPMMKNHG